MTNIANWQQQAAQHLVEQNYVQAAKLYEQAITTEPDVKSHYWHLGLILLLQGQEEEAQMTWFLALAEGEPEQVDLWTTELIGVLQSEATRQEKQANYSVAWAIRQHIREISPTNINNLLHLLELAIKQERLTDEDFSAYGIVELLKLGKPINFDINLLLHVIQSILEQNSSHPLALELVEASLAYVQEPINLLAILLPKSIKIAYSQKCPQIAARILELYLRLDAENIEVLRHLACFYQDARDHTKGIDTAKLCNSKSQTLPEKICTTHVVLRGLMSAGGHWQEAYEVMLQQEKLVLLLLKEQLIPQNEIVAQRLFNCAYFFPYLRGDLKNYRYIQNQLAQLCQLSVQLYAREQVERYRQRSGKNSKKPLKIGYLSHCFKSHSVGWLARWIFQYHDREQFKIYSYFIGYSQLNDPLQEWYLSQADQAYKAGIDGLEIAEKIYTDAIDILIDLDSITLDTTCEVMALKPAPVQVTWLGWDASGIPAIDYFIADPYVVPDSAQDYYSEKLWRLPQTYIAVDGFEVGVPTLRRDQLDIPSNAIVYLSSQNGYKHHPDTIRWQMQILKAVPNSYFLIKGKAEDESIKNFFNQIAEEEGVSCDRLRFLPTVASESVHRANLSIADVVLDTYPYNGATTTLETLWMGIPIVTRVGEQFAARNSYTMMMNAGLTAGIAWTDEEYVEWGVRLGIDPVMRQQITWQLQKSRQTSPLWNAQQFTRELEKAYQQMWTKYIKTQEP